MQSAWDRLRNYANKIKHFLNPIMKTNKQTKTKKTNQSNHVTHKGKKGLKMRYTTMDVENIFKSLFGIYKTTKLLMHDIL